MADEQSVAGKVIVVTGAGRGIGREIAMLAAKEGAKVVVNDFGGSESGEGGDIGPAQETVNDINAGGGQAVANTASVSDPAGAESIIKDAADAFGRVDAVVNNAGILRDRIFHKMSHLDWEQVIGVHLMGTFYVSKAASAYFREQQSGAFVNFTSTSGLIGQVGQANYAAAKMGIVGLTTSIALDMQRYNVRANAIAPFAWSRLIATIPTETEAQKARVEKLKTMTPDKIAPLAVYLCSDMAKDVTGQAFCVRKNELFLFNLPRPVRSVHNSEGWTPQSIHEHAMPMFRSAFMPLETSGDIFSWDPI